MKATSEKFCVCCARMFVVEGRIVETPDLCRGCWNFARVNFSRYGLLAGDFAETDYPVEGGCILGSCRMCDEAEKRDRP